LLQLLRNPIREDGATFPRGAVKNDGVVNSRGKYACLAYATTRSQSASVILFRLLPAFGARLTSAQPAVNQLLHDGRYGLAFLDPGDLESPDRFVGKVDENLALRFARFALAIGFAHFRRHIDIPRSRQNPKNSRIDDAEVVADRIAEFSPVLGDFFA
jgi:hypothetical protein